MGVRLTLRAPSCPVLPLGFPPSLLLHQLLIRGPLAASFPPPGFLTLQVHSTWRRGVRDHLLECWQAPARCQNSSPGSLCPSGPSLERPASHCTRHVLCAVAPPPRPLLSLKGSVSPLAAQADARGVASDSPFSLAPSSSPSGSPATTFRTQI